MPVANTDHVKEALANLVAQFQGKQNTEDLLTSYVDGVQELDDVFIQVLDAIIIDTAEGVQLDGIGDIVGEERFGRTDAVYRTAIKARIKLNNSNGTIEDIIGLIIALAGAVSIEIEEAFPAQFLATIVSAIDPAVIDPFSIATFVREGKPAGVNGITIFHVADPFQFDTGLGFDDGKYGAAA